MEPRHLHVKCDQGELRFDRIHKGNPVYKGLNLETDLWTSFGVMKTFYSFVLTYESGVWILLYHKEGEFFKLSTLRDDSPKYGFSLPSLKKNWTRSPTEIRKCGHYPLLIRGCFKQIRNLTKVLSRVEPFNWQIFSELRRDMRDKIIFLFLVFRRLFIMKGVILPEEMIVKILTNLDVITE